MKKSTNFKNLLGMVFERLTVVGEPFRRNGRTLWPVKCSCGTEKVAASSDLLSGTARSCGCLRREMNKSKGILTWEELQEFFESRINKNGPIPAHKPELGPCWIYTGSIDTRGYGRINSKGLGITIKTHRLSWKLYRGPITPDEFMCHKCDNPPCCNPDHLFVGDDSANFKDMWEKGRGHISFGENHQTAKLSESDVIEIRRIWSGGGVTQDALGKRFGVTQGNISTIVHGKRWTHLNEQTTPRT